MGHDYYIKIKEIANKLFLNLALKQLLPIYFSFAEIIKLRAVNKEINLEKCQTIVQMYYLSAQDIH
jgi:hypothetical protein